MLSGHVYLTGSRYRVAGVELPSFRAWVEEDIGVPCKITAPASPPPKITQFPNPVKNNSFISSLGEAVRISFDAMERLHHSHGHTAQEVLSKLSYFLPYVLICAF